MSSYVNDPIGDMLTRMRNAQSVRHQTCRIPLSKLKLQLCELLKKEGWLKEVQTEGEAPRQSIVVEFAEDRPSLEIKRVSKPGRRVYKGYNDLKPILRGFGTAVLTTSQGLMTDKEARAQKLGGEVLCTIS